MESRSHVFLLAGIAIAIILYPCFMEGTFYSYDAMAHYQRMKDINNQISHFNVLPLFDYYSDNWYGYSWNLFYPPLSAYLMGVVKLITLYSISDANQFKATVGIIIIIAFISMYFASLKLLESRYYASIASILFICSGYFLNDAYIRIDIGELMAMAFAPMVIVGARAILIDRPGKALFPAGVLFILLSNIPSFIVCLIYAVLYFLINIKKSLTKRVLILLAKSIIFVVLSSLFFTIPLIYHFIKGEVFAFQALAVSYNTIGKFGVSLNEMLFAELLTSGMTTKGLVISSGVVLNILFLCYIAKRVILDSLETTSIFIIATLFLIASTQLFPWYMISEKTPVLRFIQFPWRLMLMAVPAIVLLSVSYLKSINLSLINYFALIFSFIFSFSPMQAAIQKRASEIQHHEFHDYMNTSFEDAKHDNIKEIQSIKKMDYIKSIKPSWSSLNFDISHPENGKIKLPVMYYPGYNAKYNGRDVSVGTSDNGIVTIDGPAQGTIELSYSKLLTLAPFILSLASLFSFSFIYFRRR